MAEMTEKEFWRALFESPEAQAIVKILIVLASIEDGEKQVKANRAIQVLYKSKTGMELSEQQLEELKFTLSSFLPPQDNFQQVEEIIKELEEQEIL